jgi:glucose-1-phosphate adenylyltransferase
VDIETATQMGIFPLRSRRRDRRLSTKSRKKPRLREIGRSIPVGATFADHTDERPFMASMGVYVFSRRVLIDMLERDGGHDFGRELIPGAIGNTRCSRTSYRGYWADVGTIESFYREQRDARTARLTLPLLGQGPADLHTPASSARLADPNVHARDSLISEGCYLAGAAIETSVVGVRCAMREGTRVSRSVLLGADFYEYRAPPDGLPGSASARTSCSIA